MNQHAYYGDTAPRLVAHENHTILKLRRTTKHGARRVRTALLARMDIYRERATIWMDIPLGILGIIIVAPAEPASTVYEYSYQVPSR